CSKNNPLTQVIHSLTSFSPLWITLVDNSVDNSVDKFNTKVIHILSTAFPQPYPQHKHLFFFKKNNLSTEKSLPNNNNI
ncbi:MAG: hypothetical protein VXW65_13625, partial [Pseudomonadota bacterium]|nr:hypothetical protein [Pseudomonadota bacterium]